MQTPHGSLYILLESTPVVDYYKHPLGHTIFCFYQPPMVEFYQNPLDLLYCIGATGICATREKLTNPQQRGQHILFFFYQPPVVDFLILFLPKLLGSLGIAFVSTLMVGFSYQDPRVTLYFINHCADPSSRTLGLTPVYFTPLAIDICVLLALPPSPCNGFLFLHGGEGGGNVS